jgi:putative thioredoxin
MKPSGFIVDVSEADFEFEVLAFSQQVPVIVDFWAEWCGPCKVLSPILEKLAEEGAGAFRLAKVDVDENPNLAMRFNVRGIPSVKAFRDGNVVSEFTGARPEPMVREFIRSLAPSPSDLNLEKGLSFLRQRQPERAETAFRSVLENMPENSTAILGLVKSLLLQGRGAESRKLLRSIPASREYTKAEALLPLASALEDFEEADYQHSSEDSQDALEASYYNALRLITRGNIPAALDGFLEILHQDKHYRQAHKIVLGLLELISEDEDLARQYRNELAAVLF